MQRVTYSLFIPAPRQTVWDAVIGKETYPQWTEDFCPGSDVRGEWKAGEKIHFIAPNAEGTHDGMYSEIAELRPLEYISIHHLGILRNDQPVTEGKEAQEWKDAYENYTFTEEGAGTMFRVDIDLEENWIPFFNDLWPKALERVKQICIDGESNLVSVFTWIKAPTEKVWEYYTNPAHVTRWNFASPDWECPTATADLREGGKFSSRMQAKDGNMGFDFGGAYTKVEAPTHLAYRMDDGRTAQVDFRSEGEYVHVTVRFEKESMNPRALQKQGWQAILTSFADFVATQV